MEGIVEKLQMWINQVEALATDTVARIAPWAAPVPTAYLVGRATVVHLHWPVWVGIVAAIIVESLGLATTVTAFELREYNQSKRKSDPVAPFGVAAGLVGIYVGVAVGLTVALDISDKLVQYAPVIFPLLSLCGVTVLALRRDHRRRVVEIEQGKAERRMSRGVSGNVQGDVQIIQVDDGKRVQRDTKNVQNGVLDGVNVSKRARRALLLDAMVDIYRDSPGIGATDLARQLGIGRSTVYTYNEELIEQGRIHRNGTGWLVK
jgi:hypothetical protein